ncbi:hypothetical protein GJAV_G00062270 [Gymnothorax javanicus]|nr:hypothetical protein GJAV_G00062270 [Gymnothorax javanicus]
MAKQKKNLSEAEIEMLTSKAQWNKLVLFGSLKSGIKGCQRAAVWKEITTAVTSIGVDKQTPAEVRKKWSDLKITSKKRTAGPQPCTNGDGGACGRSSGISLCSGISGGGDTDAPPVSEPDDDESKTGTSAQPSAAPTYLEPASQTQPSYGRVHTSSAPCAALPQPRILTTEVLERRAKICQLMAEINRTLQALDNTLRKINENFKNK